MTLIEDRPTVSSHAHSAKKNTMGRTIVKWMTSTDHKVIGNLYLISSFIFFMIAGLMAMVIRAELARPGLQLNRQS
jgi:cytochrome c oxidase subunit 1